MKTSSQITFWYLALSSSLIGSLILKVQADTRVPFPSISSASGVWIGYGDHRCFRLELDKDGTGYFAMAGLIDDEGRFLPNTGELHRVTKWQPDGYRIRAELAPLKNRDDTVFLTNSYLGGFSMDMDLEISQGAHKSKVTLYNESELRARTEKLKEGIDTYRKKGERK